MVSAEPLRIGVLGAARIAPNALIKPGGRVPGVEVTAVAARDPSKATAFAHKHGVPRVLSSYDDLVADPEIDAIYNPLPNSLHLPWTLRALDAGKHVLCEKPFASNASEAQQMADAAARTGLVVMEAFHWRYHALAERMRTIAHDGRLGEIASVRVVMAFPLPRFGDIRYDYSLAGGALMDACYPVHVLRLLAPGEPRVVSAEARLHGDAIDRAMSVVYSFDGSDATGETCSSMWSRRLLNFSARVVGTQGSMKVLNYLAPQYGNLLTVRVDGVTTRSRVRGEATYDAQLRAFVAAATHGGPNLTPAADAVKTMSLIDDAYRAAGLPIRGAFTSK